MSDTFEREVEIRGEMYVVRLGDGGIELRRLDGVWPHQYLLYDNVRILIETKNAAFDRHRGNLAECNRAWQQEIVDRLQKNMPPAPKQRKAEHK